MNRKEFLLTVIPFSGFYESCHSSELDEVGQREAEYMAERDEETLDASEIADAMYWSADYGVMHRYIAKEYAEYFAHVLGEELPLVVRFESMTSPREYNFATDRIFCHISIASVYALAFATSEETLREVIRERFTSRSGFSSFYSNDYEDWAEKPLEDWDHNEVETLLIAAMRDLGMQDDLESDVFERMSGNGVYDSAFDHGMNWQALEARLNDKRAEALENA